MKKKISYEEEYSSDASQQLDKMKNTFLLFYYSYFSTYVETISDIEKSITIKINKSQKLKRRSENVTI